MAADSDDGDTSSKAKNKVSKKCKKKAKCYYQSGGKSKKYGMCAVVGVGKTIFGCDGVKGLTNNSCTNQLDCDVECAPPDGDTTKAGKSFVGKCTVAPKPPAVKKTHHTHYDGSDDDDGGSSDDGDDGDGDSDDDDGSGGGIKWLYGQITNSGKRKKGESKNIPKPYYDPLINNRR
jgi:hypothetical protein